MPEEQITLATFLKSASRQLTGISFDSNPITLRLKDSEFDSWKLEQERILGVKYIIKDRKRAPETAINRRYLWRHRYVCHRSGNPRIFSSNVTPSKRRKLQKDSIKCGCEAYILVKKHLDDDIAGDEVVIEYHWHHSGHVPANTDHSQHVGLSSDVSNFHC